MTEQWKPINVWNKGKYQDRIESINDENSTNNLQSEGSKLSQRQQQQSDHHYKDIGQRSTSIDPQDSVLAETQREPIHVFPSDFGGYVLHPEEHNLNQDSTFKQSSDDMIPRNQMQQQQHQKQPSSVNFNKTKTNEPPGYQAEPVLTHDKDVAFFGDSNVASERQPASRSTLDQDSLQRGTVSTLPSAGSTRRRSSGPQNDDGAKDEAKKPSLMDMATAAVASVGAVGAAAASGVSHAFMGHNATSSGDYNFIKSQQSSNMPSSWPSATSGAATGTNRTKDSSVLGISSEIQQEGPGAKNATNCNYEPAIHGQSPCFYTKDQVCDETVKDIKHPFCENVKEPSIHGQNPSFYCTDEGHVDHHGHQHNEFIQHDLPVSNVEQSFAAHSQSPRSSLTTDELPHGFPNHAVLPVSNVEQCLNDSDQIGTSSRDNNKDLSESYFGLSKSLLAGAAGAGAGAVAGGLLSRNQDKKAEQDDDNTVPKDDLPNTNGNTELKRNYSDAENWDNEQEPYSSELPKTWGDQVVPIDHDLTNDSSSHARQVVNTRGYVGDEGITPTAGHVTSSNNESYNPQLVADELSPTSPTNVSHDVSDPSLVNNIAAGGSNTTNEGSPVNKDILLASTAGGALAGGALLVDNGAFGSSGGNKHTAVNGQGLNSAPRDWAADNSEPMTNSDSSRQPQTWLSNDDQQDMDTTEDMPDTMDDYQDITAGAQGWSSALTTPQAMAIDNDQDISKAAPWINTKIDQGSSIVPYATWNNQTTPGKMTPDSSDKAEKKGVFAGGISSAAIAAAAAGGILNINKHNGPSKVDDESMSSTRATTGKIVPDDRNQDEIKDRPVEHHENFKNVPDSLDSNQNIRPKSGRRKNSLTQGLKTKAAAVTGVFTNVARRLSKQGPSGSAKKDSVHVRRISDAEMFKNQTLQDELAEQSAFGNYDAAFGGSNRITPAPKIIRTSANTTNVPFNQDQNAVRASDSPLDHTQDDNVIHPSTVAAAATTATTSEPLNSELDRQATTTNKINDENVDPLARDHVGEDSNIAARRVSSGSDHLKYTGVNQDYARIPGVHSMKPTGTNEVGDDGQVNFIKAEEGKKSVPNMTSYVSGKLEHRRGSIQKTMGKLFGSGSMRDKGALKQISGQEKINAYNAAHNKL